MTCGGSCPPAPICWVPRLVRWRVRTRAVALASSMSTKQCWMMRGVYGGGMVIIDVCSCVRTWLEHMQLSRHVTVAASGWLMCR